VAQLVALRNIKAGEEATISYIDQCVLALSRPALLLRPFLRSTNYCTKSRTAM
jgi:hypothetical protein